MVQQLGLATHLTHKANLKRTRYGWLRLTPAYSVHLVNDLLDQLELKQKTVFDPFCGTGTTALVCAERGIYAETIDINPFLVWLAQTKTDTYSQSDLADFRYHVRQIAQKVSKRQKSDLWFPNIHQIEKWWSPDSITALSIIIQEINAIDRVKYSKSINLLKIVFCRLLIDYSNANFNHQSMSIKKTINLSMFDVTETIANDWLYISDEIYYSAKSIIMKKPEIMDCDARSLSERISKRYDCVITSPPYPNRMSYIRELRPYMYWLGYLHSGREAGELDWQAIGGTWGIATSYVSKWQPQLKRDIPYSEFETIYQDIASQSITLANYIYKYFYDMIDHLEGMTKFLNSGSSIHYIVGNSKFYDVLLPVEQIYAAMFDAVGFKNIKIQPIRKRTSKKELFEYHVSAQA